MSEAIQIKSEVTNIKKYHRIQREMHSDFKFILNELQSVNKNLSKVFTTALPVKVSDQYLEIFHKITEYQANLKELIQVSNRRCIIAGEKSALDTLDCYFEGSFDELLAEMNLKITEGEELFKLILSQYPEALV